LFDPSPLWDEVSHKAFAAPLSRTREFEMKQDQERAECDEKKRRCLFNLTVSAFD
jgi:hypothetical protein